MDKEKAIKLFEQFVGVKPKSGTFPHLFFDELHKLAKMILDGNYDKFAIMRTVFNILFWRNLSAYGMSCSKHAKRVTKAIFELPERRDITKILKGESKSKSKVREQASPNKPKKKKTPRPSQNRNLEALAEELLQRCIAMGLPADKVKQYKAIKSLTTRIMIMRNYLRKAEAEQ